MESLETLWYERCLDYTAFAATTVFLYDYALTLPSEVGHLTRISPTEANQHRVDYSYVDQMGWLARETCLLLRAYDVGTERRLIQVIRLDTLPSSVFLSYSLINSDPKCRAMCVATAKPGRSTHVVTGVQAYKSRWHLLRAYPLPLNDSAALQTILGAMTFAIIAPITGSADGYCTYLAETIPHMLHRLVAGTYLSMVESSTT
ncbi:hypothetical protein PIIN_10975 [Serendipita indica DSM 11827]|uniref:DUF6533 domain-containing protein n=1 Tax=Serendipita indica (strain DSM 11827) TaxID=1109443 RepID=G4U097_SERID|nr:hypothetical protein PIIN_10975 [Serendipita indica DSM 11827]